MPGLVLMENAGRGIVDLICRVPISGPVLIACGAGNNAGDGFVVARQLDLLGFDVHVLLTCDPHRLRGDAGSNLAWLAASGVIVHSHQRDMAGFHSLSEIQPSVVVDALLGTGTRGAPRPPLDRLIGHLNQLSAERFAVDLPSGLDADTGKSSEATFRAGRHRHVCRREARLSGARSPSLRRRAARDRYRRPSPLLERFGITGAQAEA